MKMSKNLKVTCLIKEYEKNKVKKHSNKAIGMNKKYLYYNKNQ